MGCDIHLHIEFKVNGKWRHYSKPQIERNYSLFSKMANVRSCDDEIVPISNPRGLPVDISFTTKFCATDWGRDGHSHSYLTAQEIVELDKWLKERCLIQGMKKNEAIFVFDRKVGFFFGNTFSGFTEHPQERPKCVEDVRFVFWFDN